MAKLNHRVGRHVGLNAAKRGPQGVPRLCDGAHKAGAGPVPSQGHADGQSRPGTCSIGD
jgi:hypothetical protein